MQMDQVSEAAVAHLGGYLLTTYSDRKGGLHAPNAVSALGAWAGAFAQVQARALLVSGVIPQTESTLLEMKTKDGASYYFGDAINACLLEGSEAFPAFWNLAAGAAKDSKVVDKIGLMEIVRHTSSVVGTSKFGVPRINNRYKPSEAPIDAVRMHGPLLLRHFLQLQLNPAMLMTVFGAAAQHFATFAAEEARDVRVTVAMPRLEIVRLYMESAVPMSKLDLASVGMATR